MTTEPENSLWDFSLAVYSRPGVAEACLALQDRHGLDVNLMLLCCWAGSHGRRLDASDVARLMGAVGEWQRAVIGPLRGVRRRLKRLEGVDSERLGTLRQAVKDCELDAERIEQIMLRDALAPPAERALPATGQAACAAANLTGYLEVAGVSTDATDTAFLEAILCGAFDALSRDAAKRLLQG